MSNKLAANTSGDKQQQIEQLYGMTGSYLNNMMDDLGNSSEMTPENKQMMKVLGGLVKQFDPKMSTGSSLSNRIV